MTPKQKLFCQEYLVDLNATQAAIRAGYSEKTANRIATENLSKPVIAEAIKEAMAERSEKMGLTQVMVIEGLLKEARNEGKGSSHSARVAAWATLGKHLGMFHERLEMMGKPNQMILKVVYEGRPGGEMM
ncbi:MAG: terminase small subunit [Candidatus Subteraquimicrobiales bacterium]|nr:terminase small subunit [Candidatus Subteraquimicrobiales bacterium]